MNSIRNYSIVVFLIFISLVLFLNYALNIDKNEKSHPVLAKSGHTKIRVENHLIDIGEIKKDSLALARFKLVNIGKTPLIINDARVGCHCTVVDWSKAPLASGDSTFITVRYDSSHPGFFLKKITVFSNALNSPTLLVFRGEIILENGKSIY